MATPADYPGYFASDFFSPFYFPRLEAVGPSSENPARYFAPSFFSPYYFAPLLPIGPGVSGKAGNAYSDRDAFSAVTQALMSTGAFALVSFGTSVDQSPGGVDLYPIAIVSPEGWSECDDSDPNIIIRKTEYRVTIVVREPDPVAGYEQIDNLSCVALNVLDGSSLGGGSLPALTGVRFGRVETDAPFPERRVVLQGEFTYLIPSPNSHASTV